MSKRSGWMEYPDGMDQRVKGLEDFLRVVYFKHLNQTAREQILAEIINNYGLYYATTKNKPDPPSIVERHFEVMFNATDRMFDSIKLTNDPITTLYDYWMHRNGMAGDLKTALKAHRQALDWTERQLEAADKPAHQQETGARYQFIRNLCTIYQLNEGPEALLHSFVTEVLELLDLRAPARLSDIPN